jgi:hypothetical protein
MTDIPYLLRLREDLVTGIGRRQRRVAARRRRAALVLTPLALAGAALATTLPAGSSPALAIEAQRDWVEVRIADISASEAEMESELRAAGIDAELHLIPTTEEHVGQWTCGWLSTRPLVEPDALQEIPLAHDPDDVFRITPEAFYVRRASTETEVDSIVMVAGRAAESGERPRAHPELCGDVRQIAGN